MNYDFNKCFNRKGTGCIKWDCCPPSTCPQVLPMWIADMDFETPDFVIQGIEERLKHPVFGYFRPEQRFYDAIIQWHKDRFGVDTIKPEHILYQHSVLGSIATALEVLTDKGDGVLVQTPGYAKFKEIITQHERLLVSNPLRFDGNRYEIDYEDMEEKLQKHPVKVALFCSPSNPVGRVWEKDEIVRYVELCEKYNVTIVADEIWADFAYGRKHTPLHTVAGGWRDRVISLYAPTKTFNLAGLVISYAVIFEEGLAKQFQDYGDATHYNNCNALSMEALISAYQKGGPWVDLLNGYIADNAAFAEAFIKEHLPRVRMSCPEGTYLLWLDFQDTGYSMDEIVDRCVNRAGVILNNGRTCIDSGDLCMRMNIAAPRHLVEEGLNRLKQAFVE